MTETTGGEAALWTWTDACDGARVAFLGRPVEPTAADPSARLDPAPSHWLRLTQIHSGRVVEAREDDRPEADGYYTDVADRGLTIVTADCVPVLLALPGRVAAAHAGWRGLVAGVVAATTRRLGALPDRITAWIGPAIGPCCYEVGEEVAEAVARASDDDVVLRTNGHKPHLDLQAAAASQLRALGVSSIRRIERCTRCHADLESYRRDGEAAGRNRSVIWIDPLVTRRPESGC